MQLSTRLIYVVPTERGVIHFTARTLEELDFCIGPFILEHEELRETIMPLLLHLENNRRNALSHLSEGPARSIMSEASCLL